METKIPVTVTHVRAPLQEKPIIHLPVEIPPPKTVAHSCTCYKTILRPSGQQQIIAIPSLQQFIDGQVIKPIQFDNINSNGINGNGNGGGNLLITTPVEPTPPPSGIQISQVDTLNFPRIQTIQFPKIQTVQTLRQIPQVQLIEIPRVESFQVPTAQSFKPNCFSVLQTS